MSDLLIMAETGTGTWSRKRYSPEEVAKFIETFNLGYVIVPPYPWQRGWDVVLENLLGGNIAHSEIVDGYILLEDHGSHAVGVLQNGSSQ